MLNKTNKSEDFTRTSSTGCFDDSVSVVDSNSGVVGALAGLARRPSLAFCAYNDS